MEVKPVMEVRLSFGDPEHSARSIDLFVPRGVPAAANARAEKTGVFQLDEGDTRELLQRTVDLASVFERNLKFEIIKDAGILQIQVINSTDGAVVRKIPPDEVVKLVAYLKDQLSANMNVLA
ncbi:MAG: flagellar protein FlaG [Synergistaceae bacterium]|nr:flagellar protein FlaG [Synergistaceae bacterium]